MATVYDPQNNEIRHLQPQAHWPGARLLEIGSGDGRLTERLARLGPIIHAFDPKPNLVAQAVANQPPRLQRSLHYYVAQAEALPVPDGAFDLALFSWSL